MLGRSLVECVDEGIGRIGQFLRGHDVEGQVKHMTMDLVHRSLATRTALTALTVMVVLFAGPRVAWAAPVITSLSPSSGAVGASITIAGTGFGATKGSSTVKLNGVTATTTSWSATSIVATVPTGAASGNIVVTVSGVASNGQSFTVVPAPNIASLSPTSGAIGASVTITGTNFGATQGAGSVTFNTRTAAISSWSATSIVATVPASATTGNVVVRASGVNSNGRTFTVVVAPTISSLSPTSGVTGTVVTITGTNFGSTQGSGTVRFNGTLGTPTSWNATTIRVPVPAGATTGNVVVRASGVDSNGRTFTVTTPAITGLSPTSGQPGAAVTIDGANFGATKGSSTVKFNGTTAATTSWSATRIVATVPATATTGNVVVTVSGAASNGVNFVVPVLTGIVVGPQNASITAGTTIQYSATGTYSDGIDRLISSGTSWSSTVVAAATVASSGVATGVAEGQTTVQVTVGSISAGTLLTVLPSRFVATGRFRNARSGHLATLLENSKVLMVGGLGTSSTPLTSAELYNPVSGAFGPAGGLGTTREAFTANRLANGKVLIVGGWSRANITVLATSEVYDPASGAF
jgi:hypothetical protein